MLKKIRKQCEKHIEEFTKLYNIIIVANVREMTEDFNDYSDTSIISEFLTLNQYELIIETLRDCGFEVSSYFDENDFIGDCIERGCFRNNKKQTIVINSAQKGTAVGRKSLIPAFCDLNGIWYSNSNAYTVSLARHKFHCDSILKANSLPSLESFLYLPYSGWFSGKKPITGNRFIAKLNGETSSMGMSNKNIFIFDDEKEQIVKSLSETYKQAIIVQPFIEGFEVEIPLMATKKSVDVILPVGISINGANRLNDSILDYETRKNLRFGFYNYRTFNPCLSEAIEDCAKNVARLLGIEGFGRVDFRIDSSGDYYVTDIATNPHITEGMSFNYAFEEHGMGYREMLETLIFITVCRFTGSTYCI